VRPDREASSSRPDPDPHPIEDPRRWIELRQCPELGGDDGGELALRGACRATVEVASNGPRPIIVELVVDERLEVVEDVGAVQVLSQQRHGS
jgi:hypothetical protein